MGADAALISSFGALANANKRSYSGQLQAQGEQGKVISEGINKTAGIIAKGIQNKAEAEKKAQEDLLKAQNEQQKEINRQAAVEKNHFDKLFKKEMLKVSNALKDDGGVGPNFSDSITDRITELRGELDKWNTGERTPENSREIQKIFNKVDQVTKQVVQYRGGLMEMAESFSDGDTASELSPAATEVEKSILLTQINDELRQTKFDDKGEMLIGVDVGETVGGVFGHAESSDTVYDPSKTYDDKPQESNIKWMKAPEVLEMARRGMKDIKSEGKLTILDNTAKEQGDNLAGGDFNLTSAVSKIKQDIFYPTEGPKPNISDLALRALGDGREYMELSDPGLDSGKYDQGSWAYALQEHPDLQGDYYIDDIRAYDNAGVAVDGIDGSEPDNKVSQKEAAMAMMNFENRDRVIDLLVNPHKEGGNYDVTAGLMSQFFAGQQQVINADARAEAIAADNAAKGRSDVLTIT